ncbi:hypothetical protein [Actinoplanes solisilvae]|uniref:hypothetical protein n=1 Tax=Actinoplanes solisilvae TaxID=2486853 RepID=UPI000FDA0F01|nr:hypothetical protein [Actinoplanes solisilvae]
MRFGTPFRPAHRATADGGLVLLVRGIGPGGLHRPPPAPPPERGHRRRATVEPQRAAQWLTRGLAGAILLGLAVMIGFLVLASDRHQRTSVPLAPDQPPSLGELFPGDEIRPAGATGAYRVEMRHFDADCRTATTGELGSVLAGHGCREVVRAGLTAPYGGYRVTAGVFALPDAAAATEVQSLVRGLVESNDGGFTTVPAGGGDPATARVGWRTRDNLLLYCVITRPGGELVPGDDPYAERINSELVDTYLGGVVRPAADG